MSPSSQQSASVNGSQCVSSGLNDDGECTLPELQPGSSYVQVEALLAALPGLGRRDATVAQISAAIACDKEHWRMELTISRPRRLVSATFKASDTNTVYRTRGHTIYHSYGTETGGDNHTRNCFGRGVLDCLGWFPQCRRNNTCVPSTSVPLPCDGHATEHWR